ncbi:hypothetical protein HYU13_04190, partial [Candidatus Woesearchaeota archaeon]|nr:hypothetical protein [Candidatus Woesearchaeota archaeon]
MRSNKKGQIALFIIVGLLILLGTAFFISYAALKRQEIAPSITQTATASTPAWAAPVNEFVESCMKEIAIRGFKKLGEHGGYIDLADAGIVNKVFDLNPAPTESDVVYPSSSQAAPIPYWFYMKSPNTCTGCQVSTNKPSQSDMQAQISNYMNDELPPCLNNLQKFRDQGYSIDFGELSTTTSIDDIGVTVSVDYPITVSRAGQSAALPSFTINLDLNLNDIFQLASFILLQQVNEMFLEDTTLSLIGLKAGLPDLARVPPLYHADSKPFYVTWSMPMVEQKVKNDILASYIPLIQIANTRGAKKLVGSGPLEQGLYDSLFLEPFIGEFPDLKVNFEFNPMKQVYFSITPNENGLLKPSVSSTSPPVNIIPDQANNVYEFFYDMSFPVIVTIRDNRSLTQNGETGYTFRFAIEANIRDNKNLLDWFRGRGTIGQLDLSNVQTVTSFPQNVPGACNKRPDDKYVCELDGSPNDGRVFNQEMLCQQDCHMNIFPPADYTEVPSLECASSQKISGEHTIKLKDKKLNTPIEGARVSYSCGNSRRCFLGMTDGNGLFDGRSQICIG